LGRKRHVLAVIKEHVERKKEKKQNLGTTGDDRQRLVHHDLRLSLVRGLSSLIFLFGVITHLDILISITALFFVIFLVIVTLRLEIFTLGIGDLFFFLFLASRSFSAFHLVIIALSGLVGILELLEKRSLKFTLLSTVGTAVIIEAIGLGLIRRVLGRGRVLRVPSKKSSVNNGSTL
jgi:hypothetical protein